MQLWTNDKWIAHKQNTGIWDENHLTISSNQLEVGEIFSGETHNAREHMVGAMQASQKANFCNFFGVFGWKEESENCRQQEMWERCRQYLAPYRVQRRKCIILYDDSLFLSKLDWEMEREKEWLVWISLNKLCKSVQAVNGLGGKVRPSKRHCHLCNGQTKVK